jgi:hypothetical protein
VANRSSIAATNVGMARGICSIALFLALIQINLVITVQQRRCEDIAGHIEALKHQLPSDAHLVSIGPVHHAFAFFYRQPIPIVKLPPTDDVGHHEYFCLHTYDTDPPELPFEWSQVAVVSCDRFKGRAIPKDRVFIGRRELTQHVGMRHAAAAREYLGVPHDGATIPRQPELRD